MSRWLSVPLVVLIAGCNGSEANEDTKPTSTGSAIQKGSAGGFSASLSADLSKGSDAKAGSDAKVGDAKAGDAKGSDVGSDDKKVAMAGDAKAGSDAKAGDAKAGDAKAGDAKGSDAKAGDAKGSDAKVATPVVVPHPPPVSTPAELAAIKLNMEPNWDRDTVAAGTISLVVKGEAKPFVFQYGLDDPKAPIDREQYKKFLDDQKLLHVTLDRQRGAAWYLEGTNGDGAPAFRYLVNYGGKHLICGGLLYKDPESNKLGDIRDRVIIQAKQICESMSL